MSPAFNFEEIAPRELRPEVYERVLGQVSALVSEYRLDYLKWDHNRDLIDGGHQPSGEPIVHRHTLAVYDLIDQLRERHRGLEIESCSSGGGRVDLGILARTDRVWASDSIDAVDAGAGHHPGVRAHGRSVRSRFRDAPAAGHRDRYGYGP